MKARIRKWLGIEDTAMLRPIELKRGGLYVIESARELDRETIADIEAYLALVKKRTGCEFLLLDAGLRIATAEEGEARCGN